MSWGFWGLMSMCVINDQCTCIRTQPQAHQAWTPLAGEKRNTLDISIKHPSHMTKHNA